MKISSVFGDRSIGFNDHEGSSLTLAWLAGHRKRLRSFIIGGHRLTILIVWDEKGRESAQRSKGDEDAIAQLVYGYERT